MNVAIDPAAWAVAPVQWLDYQPWRERFAEAMDARLYTIDYLDRRILDGSARIWTSPDAAVITEIKTYPTGARAVHFLIVAGELEAIKAFGPMVEEWAKSLGCVGALIESRPAWAREMKSAGYEVHQVSIWKDL